MAIIDYMGIVIGNSFGEIMEVDVDENNEPWGKFMRVRVNLDISKPLSRGKKVMLGLLNPAGSILATKIFSTYVIFVQGWDTT